MECAQNTILESVILLLQIFKICIRNFKTQINYLYPFNKIFCVMNSLQNFNFCNELMTYYVPRTFLAIAYLIDSCKLKKCINITNSKTNNVTTQIETNLLKIQLNFKIFCFKKMNFCCPP